MSATHLPHRVAPLRLARDGVRMQGTLPADRLPRLLDSVAGVPEPVRVELDFHLDEEQRICLTGSLRAEVDLVCQRCLEQYRQILDCRLNVALVKSEADLAMLPSSYDGVVVPREPVALAELLEDDLILAIPAVPQHAEGACSMPAVAEEQEEQAAVHPFAALRKLKGK